MNKVLLIVACAVYIISPIDFIPDIPVIGWGDDVVAGLIGLKALLSDSGGKGK